MANPESRIWQSMLTLRAATGSPTIVAIQPITYFSQERLGTTTVTKACNYFMIPRAESAWRLKCVPGIRLLMLLEPRRCSMQKTCCYRDLISRASQIRRSWWAIQEAAIRTLAPLEIAMEATR